MTKKQYNDDALYQEIMASLEPGAAEYDRMMASGEAPAKRKRVSSLVWYAAAAAVVGLLVVTATMFVGNEDVGQRTASTIPVSVGKHLAEKAAVPHMENADSDLHRLTARIEPAQQKKQPLYPTPQKSIYTAMLPEVDFCPEESDDVRSNAVSSNDVRLPQVSKERSFNLICKVMLPEIIACADSTIYQSTEMMVACDEIEYNDNPFKNVSL